LLGEKGYVVVVVVVVLNLTFINPWKLVLCNMLIIHFSLFLSQDTYTNQWFSDIELSVDAEVVKASSLLQDYCLLVARVCPHLAAYLLASLVECTERS